MIFTLLWMACGLPAEGERSRAELEAALQAADVNRAARAAREADPWKGRDPLLDRALGAVLANLLMRPEEGLELLLSRPSPADPLWVEAVADASLRLGQPARLAETGRLPGLPPLDPDHGSLGQWSARARLDPGFGWAEAALEQQSCALAVAEPARGRRKIDHPLPSTLLEGARSLGATELALSRPERATDSDPLSGRGLTSCEGLRIYPSDALPDPLPVELAVAARDERGATVFLNVHLKDGGHWIYAANDPEAAERWLRAADLVAQPGGSAKVQAELGLGLGPPPPVPLGMPQ